MNPFSISSAAVAKVFGVLQKKKKEGWGLMQINKFIIPKKFLTSISEDEKIFAVQLGYFLNEVKKSLEFDYPRSQNGALRRIHG